MLNFDSADIVKPQERAAVVVNIYDGEYKVAQEELDAIIGRLPRENFEAHLEFSNIENIRFAEILINEDEKMLIEEIKPLK